jgi:hypothetical protein
MQIKRSVINTRCSFEDEQLLCFVGHNENKWYATPPTKRKKKKESKENIIHVLERKLKELMLIYFIVLAI